MSNLVFDVGANEGNKTVGFLAQGNRVVCFEPQPNCASVLRSRFNADVIVVEKAVGAYIGKLPMHICSSAGVLSTLSDEWRHGRHKNFKWDKIIEVDVITLDAAIIEFGIPKQIKIDVEGFELPVLQGLSTAVDLLSFEFTCEFISRVSECAGRLLSLGRYEFNFCRGDSSAFMLERWVAVEQLMCRLRGVSDKDFWGDVYARRK